MMREPLKPKELELFEVVRKNRRVVIPSVRELAKLIGEHPATVQYRLQVLRAKGWLKS